MSSISIIGTGNMASTLATLAVAGGNAVEIIGRDPAKVDFFNDLGSPGGAAKLGKIDKDHPIIAALPPQEHDE